MAMSSRILWDLVQKELLPRLRATSDEIAHVLDFLDGKAVPAGPAGSPTRGRLDVLPTGRNFFLRSKGSSYSNKFSHWSDLADALSPDIFKITADIYAISPWSFGVPVICARAVTLSPRPCGYGAVNRSGSQVGSSHGLPDHSFA